MTVEQNEVNLKEHTKKVQVVIAVLGGLVAIPQTMACGSARGVKVKPAVCEPATEVMSYSQCLRENSLVELTEGEVQEILREGEPEGDLCGRDES